MGLTSALNTSLNGLTLNETTIDVLGNNIANAGTNGFKSSQVLFESQLARTMSVGSRPSAISGGTNPRQIGLGASVSTIRKDFTQGPVTGSTSASDLAIQGDGFFILNSASGDVYTRNGNFTLNNDNLLVNAQGLKLQGYGIADDFSLITTQLVDLNIPLGEMNVAQQTRNVRINGALMPTGDMGTNGSLSMSEVLTDTVTTLPATGASLLSDLENAAGTTLFTVGQTLAFATNKGGRTLEAQTFEVTATSTLAELAAFMDDTIGLHSGGTIPADGNTGTQPGISIVGGQLQVVGNAGSVNDLVLSVGDLTSNGVSIPIAFTKSETAIGESAITDFVVFDSLGQPVALKMTSVMESKTGNSTTFRWFIESPDDSRTDVAIASGVVTFDSFGQVVDNGTHTFSIERNNSAAVSPMQITLDLTQISGISSETAGSRLSLQNQDGSDPGTLTGFVVDEGGVINGVFDNGIIRTLGQVVLARFSNPQGLLEAGGTNFSEGVSSGPPFLTTPGSFGAGTLRAGAIELSNTDIGRNLVDLIVASTNYRGNARVISSVQQLVDELLVLGR